MKLQLINHYICLFMAIKYAVATEPVPVLYLAALKSRHRSREPMATCVAGLDQRSKTASMIKMAYVHFQHASVCESISHPRPVSFSVGEEFRSYNLLERKIRDYEDQHYVKFWKLDCRTVDAARRHVNKALNDSLKYYEVTFCCIHRGKKF